MEELISMAADQGIAIALCVYLLYERHKEQTGVKATMDTIAKGMNEMVIILRERMPDHKINLGVL